MVLAVAIAAGAVWITVTSLNLDAAPFGHSDRGPCNLGKRGLTILWLLNL